jgi:hypothetical protein
MKFIVTLVPLPHVTHPIIALRAVLKFALRQCGLRAIDAREEIPVDPDESAPGRISRATQTKSHSI